MQHDPQFTSQFLQRAVRWFLESGIQESSGGVARYYHSDLGRNASVSTEITGYCVSTLVYLHARTGDGACLDAALRAGRFLTRTAWDAQSRTLPFELAVEEPRAYFFDLGIIARGLLALWRATGEEEFLATARACAESMARDFSAGCEFHPILILPSKEPLARDLRWSRSPGCYQLKAALAWHELGEEFAAHYDHMLEFAARTEESFLAVEPERARVMDRLHAYCYFLEGLLPRVSEPAFAARLREGIARVSTLLAGIGPEFERSDVCAQLLRARLFAAALGVTPLDDRAAQGEAERIAAYQLDHADARIRGGVCFGRRAGALAPHVNPVSTAFGLQALDMWRRYGTGGFSPDWRALI